MVYEVYWNVVVFMKISMNDYIKLHESWLGTICKVCDKQDFGPYYEIYKNGRWTFICKECVDEISQANNLKDTK